MPRKTKISGWPVMSSMCVTCPFRPGGDVELQNRVLSRTLLNASQICHHPRTHGKRETHLCRGARDVQLTILHRLGMIAEPTDAAFAEASEKHLRRGTCTMER